MSTVNMTLDGDAALMRLFSELPDKIRNKHLAIAVAAGASPILQDARAHAAKETGLLKKAIKFRARSYKQGDVRIAVIGVSRDVMQLVRRNKSGRIKKLSKKKASEAWGQSMVGAGKATKPRRPANYGHLVEFGHRIATGGTLKRTNGGVGAVSKVGSSMVQQRYTTNTGRRAANGMSYRQATKAGATYTRRAGKREGGSHSGDVAPRPFLVPAYRRNQAAALDAIRRKLKQAIESEAASLRGKGG